MQNPPHEQDSRSWPHPEQWIEPADIVLLRQAECAAEKSGHLLPEQWNLIRQRNWLALFVPTACHGLGMSLPAAVQQEEALAWCAGSVGWTVTLCSGANWFIGFMNARQRSALFGKPGACLAGSGMATGIARLQPDGSYLVQGDWPYATGADHATAFTANCKLMEGEREILDAFGAALLITLWFYPEEVELINDWQPMGLRATASHRFRVPPIRITEERIFRIDANRASLPDPVYQFPFMDFANVTLMANYMGMTIRLLELCNPQINAEHRLIWEQLNKSFYEQRAQYYQLLTNSWYEMQQSSEQKAALYALRNCHVAMIRLIQHIIQRLIPLSGMEAITDRTPLNIVYRNLIVAGQHPVLRDESFQ